MKLQWTKPFVKDYQKLPEKIQKQTDRKLKFLIANPRHPSLRLKKVKGEKDIFELSITMNYRLTFSIATDAYVLRHVGTHTDILGR